MPKRKPKEKTPIFTHGYKEVREKVGQGSKFIRSCFNCAYFYQSVGDTEEMCQNSEVLKYDMVIDGNNIYCLRWEPSGRNRTQKQTMFRRGRAILD